MTTINLREIPVTVLNACQWLEDGDAQATVNALEEQVHKHFAPVWRIDAKIAFCGGVRGQRLADILQNAKIKLTPGAWWLVLLDNSDQAGYLGYHDVTNEGLPMAKVFIESAKQSSQQWSVAASHELLEMLVDPGLNLAAFRPTVALEGVDLAPRICQPPQTLDEAMGRLYAYEVCDPCRADNYGYEINGIRVSDFVYPTWFEWFRRPQNTQFDHGDHIKEPFQVLPGGSISVLDIVSGTGWRQIFEPTMTARDRANMRPRMGSRRQRRHILGDWGGLNFTKSP